MTINTRELIEAVSVVADDHNIRVTIQSSIKASAIVAGTTFVGAFVRIESNDEIQSLKSFFFR